MAHDLRLTVARWPSPPAPFFLMPQSRSLRRPDGEGWAGSPDALTETATGRRLLSPSVGSLPPTEMSPSPDARLAGDHPPAWRRRSRCHPAIVVERLTFQTPDRLPARAEVAHDVAPPNVGQRAFQRARGDVERFRRAAHRGVL